MVHQALGPERDETLAPFQFVPREHLPRLSRLLRRLHRVSGLVTGPLRGTVEVGDGVTFPGAPVHVGRGGPGERPGEVARRWIRGPVRSGLSQPVVAEGGAKHGRVALRAGVLAVPVRHLVGHPDVLRCVGHDGLYVGHADGHLRPAWDVRRVLPRWIAVDADWVIPSMPRLRRLFQLVRVQPGAFLRCQPPRLTLALLPSLHRALALFPTRDSLDALRDFFRPLCVRFRRPETGSVRLDRAADCPVP